MNTCKRVKIWGLSGTQEINQIIQRYGYDIQNHMIARDQFTQEQVLDITFYLPQNLIHFHQTYLQSSKQINANLQYYLVVNENQYTPINFYSLYATNIPLQDIFQQLKVYLKSMTGIQLFYDKKTLKFKNSGIVYFEDENDCYYQTLSISNYKIKFYPSKYQFKYIELSALTYTIQTYEEAMKQLQMKINVYIDKVNDYQVTVNTIQQHNLDDFVIFNNVPAIMIAFFDKKIYDNYKQLIQYFAEKQSSNTYNYYTNSSSQFKYDYYLNMSKITFI